MLLAPYDGFTKPSLISTRLKIWIQFHDPPDGFSPLVKPLAVKVGELYVEENNSGIFQGISTELTVKVILGVRKPLTNRVSIVKKKKKKKRQIIKEKYHRLLDWCA